MSQEHQVPRVAQERPGLLSVSRAPSRAPSLRGKHNATLPPSVPLSQKQASETYHQGQGRFPAFSFGLDDWSTGLHFLLPDLGPLNECFHIRWK